MLINFNGEKEIIILDNILYEYKNFPSIKKLEKVVIIKGDFISTQKATAVGRALEVLYDCEISFFDLTKYVDIYFGKNTCRYKGTLLSLEDLNNLLKTKKLLTNKKKINHENLEEIDLSIEKLWPLVFNN